MGVAFQQLNTTLTLLGAIAWTLSIMLLYAAAWLHQITLKTDYRITDLDLLIAAVVCAVFSIYLWSVFFELIK